MAGWLWLAGALVARAAEDGPVVDVTRVFVFANAETIAMGGAGAAFATGTNGMVLNPAAPANRRKETTGAVFSSLMLSETRTSQTRDVANLGEAFDETGHVYNAGGTLGYRPAAVGVLVSGAWYQLPDTFTGTAEGHVDIGYAFLGGRAAVGAGARLLGVRSASDGDRADYFGAGAEIGAIFPNVAEHWNFALALRSGVRAETRSTLEMPLDGARLPPQAAIGVGWSTGGDVNVPVRVAADLVVDGPVKDAVSLEKLLVGEIVPRGERASISPRGGAEVEVWRDRLRLRGGGYLEAARTDLAGSRPHATGGFELRLFEVESLGGRLKLDLAWQAGIDYAPRYLRLALLGLNLWGSGAVGGVYVPTAGAD
jgi:hypothetical protein